MNRARLGSRPLPLELPRRRKRRVKRRKREEERQRLIEEGHRATLDLLDMLGPEFDPAGHGVYPQRKVQIRVDRERCVGCGACVMHAPWVFEMDEGGRAAVRQPVQSWSPLDGAYVRNYPTYAISARLATPSRP